MSQSTESMVGILLIILVAVGVGSIFIGDLLSTAGEDAQTRVMIDRPKVFQQLVMYDAMAAYGCEVGGWLDADGDKYWGDWNAMKQWSLDPDTGTLSAADTIDFRILNATVPQELKNLPCYGARSTLPGTGNLAQEFGPYSKEWRDDQEGKYSRIKFKVNSTSELTLPACWGHHTYNEGVVDGSLHEPYERGDVGNNEVANSMYIMTDNAHKSSFKAHEGIDFDGYPCPRVADGGTKDYYNYGTYMNINVIDPHGYAKNKNVVKSTTVNGHDIDFVEYTLASGTTGYIQTNTGCKNLDVTGGGYDIDDPPGLSNMEVGPDHCDNKIHPFIVLTSDGS